MLASSRMSMARRDVGACRGHEFKERNDECSDENDDPDQRPRLAGGMAGAAGARARPAPVRSPRVGPAGAPLALSPVRSLRLARADLQPYHRARSKRERAFSDQSDRIDVLRG